jgi:GntR family transcriptional repressor for pyruvate dehydrogenase complex
LTILAKLGFKRPGGISMENDALPVEFGTFDKSALPQQICDRLLCLVQGGQLRPGSKLPPERELAAMMGVSRPSLREALRALALLNVIDMRQGDGTYVTSLEPSLLTEHLDFVFSLDDSTFLQLFQARRILEPGIVAISAQTISDEEIVELEQCLAKALGCMDDHEAFLQADLELHEKITAAARNPILSRFMTALTRLGVASRRRTVGIAGVRQQSAIDHQQIVTALRNRDPESARQAMLRHLNHVEQQLEIVSTQRPAPRGSE